MKRLERLISGSEFIFQLFMQFPIYNLTLAYIRSSRWMKGEDPYRNAYTGQKEKWVLNLSLQVLSSFLTSYDLLPV